MGQSSSKKERRALTQVQRRTRDGPARDRPASFTFGETSAAPDMDPSGQGLGMSKASGSMDLTGLRFQGYPRDPDVRTNPIGAEDNVDDSDGVSTQAPSSAVVTGKGNKPEHRSDIKAAYNASLEEVLGIWPEYQSLRDFKPNKHQASLQATLQQVFKRLVEEHVSMGKMYRQNHDLRQDLQTCKNDMDSLNDIIKQKEKELTECISDIGFLRGELKRRGYDPKIPGRNQDKRQNLTVDSAEPRRHSRIPSDLSDVVFEDPKDEIEHKMRHKEIKGHAVALPLLVAEGREGQENILRRHSSFNKGTQQNSFDKDHRGGSFRSERERDTPRGEDQTRLIDDLNERIRRLQTSLDNERRTNDTLTRRLEDASNDTKSNRHSGTGRGTASMDELSHYYAELESTGMYKIMSAMDRMLGHVREHRKQEFLCAIMKKCYEHASRHVEKFEKTVRGLLQRPLDKLESDPHGRRHEPRSGRVSSAAEVPGELLDQLIEFLESTADTVDLTTLVQIIIDDLSDEYSECTTAALLNHTGFNHFIHDCSRLAWKMILVTPPLAISTDKGRGYDSRSQTIASSDVLNPRNGHQIRHFMWPTLLSRRHGDVLNKGRVILKADG